MKKEPAWTKQKTSGGGTINLIHGLPFRTANAIWCCEYNYQFPEQEKDVIMKIKGKWADAQFKDIPKEELQRVMGEIVMAFGYNWCLNLSNISKKSLDNLIEWAGVKPHQYLEPISKRHAHACTVYLKKYGYTVIKPK